MSAASVGKLSPRAHVLSYTGELAWESSPVNPPTVGKPPLRRQAPSDFTEPTLGRNCVGDVRGFLS